MTGFARRAAAGLLAAVFGISMLAGCTPNNAAVEIRSPQAMRSPTA